MNSGGGRVSVMSNKMSSLATKIKSIFSFNSDTYHVHKAVEEELLTNPQPQPPTRRAPEPPTTPSGAAVSDQSIALKPSVTDKKQQTRRKVSASAFERGGGVGGGQQTTPILRVGLTIFSFDSDKAVNQAPVFNK